nr:hypothetical protein [uncultured Acetatifactor sp.]
MISIDIADILFTFYDLSHTVCAFLQQKYKSYIVLSPKRKSDLLLTIKCLGRKTLVYANQLKIGATIENDKYILNIHCENQFFGAATLNLLDKTCFIELMDYNEEALDLLISIIWRMASVLDGKILFHASAIMLDKQAILFCGHSGAGKSTILQLLRQNNLTDEMVCLYLDKSQKPMYHGIPWRNCNSNIELPLQTIYILEKTQNIFCQDIPAEVAGMLLSKYFYFNIWVKGGRDISKYTLEDILKKVPVKKLGFNLEESERLLNLIRGQGK